MSVTVSYPVTVVSYQVSIGRNSAILILEGVEGEDPTSIPDKKTFRRVGEIFFEDPVGEERDLIIRSGFLRMWRPLPMLAGILELLQHTKPLFLSKDGALSTSIGVHMSLDS